MKNLRFPLLLLILLCLSTVTAMTQPEGYSEVGNNSEFARQLQTTTAATKSIRSDFSQEKYMQYLDITLKSSGKFWYEAPDKVRWEYQEPFGYKVIINSGKLSLISDDSENQFEMNRSALFEQVNKLMMSAITGDIGANDEYSAKLYAGKEFYLAVLVPADETVKQMIGSMELYFDKTEYMVRKIKIVEANGDYSLITFTNQHFNGKIDASVFIP